jgi:hypothetical protein
MAAGLKAGLVAMVVGSPEAESALSHSEIRTTMGYEAYEVTAQRFILPS